MPFSVSAFTTAISSLSSPSTSTSRRLTFTVGRNYCPPATVFNPSVRTDPIRPPAPPSTLKFKQNIIKNRNSALRSEKQQTWWGCSTEARTPLPRILPILPLLERICSPRTRLPAQRGPSAWSTAMKRESSKWTLRRWLFCNSLRDQSVSSPCAVVLDRARVSSWTR